MTSLLIITLLVLSFSAVDDSEFVPINASNVERIENIYTLQIEADASFLLEILFSQDGGEFVMWDRRNDFGIVWNEIQPTTYTLLEFTERRIPVAPISLIGPLSGDGSQLITAIPGAIQILSTESGTVVWEYLLEDGHTVFDARFSPDGTIIAMFVINNDEDTSYLAFVDLQTQEEIYRTKEPDIGLPAFSYTWDMMSYADHMDNVTIWALDFPSEPQMIDIIPSDLETTIESLEFIRDNELLHFTQRDDDDYSTERSTVWDIARSQLHPTENTNGFPLNEGSSLFATSSELNPETGKVDIQLWDVRDGTTLSTLSINPGLVGKSDFDGTFFTIATTTRLAFHDAETGGEITAIDSSGVYAFSPDMRHMVTVASLQMEDTNATFEIRIWAVRAS